MVRGMALLRVCVALLCLLAAQPCALADEAAPGAQDGNLAGGAGNVGSVGLKVAAIIGLVLFTVAVLCGALRQPVVAPATIEASVFAYMEHVGP